MMNIERLTAEVCRVAREAGAYLRTEQSRLRDEQVERKHSHDYVSYVDKECERQIVAQLRQLLPEAAFLTEEGTAGPCMMAKGEGRAAKGEGLKAKGEGLKAKGEERGAKGEGLKAKGEDDTQTLCPLPLALSHPEGTLCWVIDPLDGTTNYIHGFQPFAVSIALLEGSKILLGVVYEVSLDECFHAWQGGGAWLNGRPISVSRRPIGEALLGIELPYDAAMYRTLGTGLIAHLYGLCAGIRMNGSAAVALCNVACGRWDGWLERGIQPWDFMAGALIVEEAGGQVTDYEGNPLHPDGREVVASNALTHIPLLQTLRQLQTLA